MDEKKAGTNSRCLFYQGVHLIEVSVKPLCPKIQLLILQTDLHTFLLRIIERILV